MNHGVSEHIYANQTNDWSEGREQGSYPADWETAYYLGVPEMFQEGPGSHLPMSPFQMGPFTNLADPTIDETDGPQNMTTIDPSMELLNQPQFTNQDMIASCSPEFGIAGTSTLLTEPAVTANLETQNAQPLQARRVEFLRSHSFSMASPPLRRPSYSHARNMSTSAYSDSSIRSGRSLSPASRYSLQHNTNHCAPYGTQSCTTSPSSLPTSPPTPSHRIAFPDRHTSFRRDSPSPPRRTTLRLEPEQAVFQLEGSSFETQRRRKTRVSNVQRKAICQYHAQNPGVTQEALATRYGVERSTISKIMKEKDRWLNTDDDKSEQETVRHRPSKFPALEQLMVPFLYQMTIANTRIKDSDIRMRARKYAETLRIDPKAFKASSGWIDNFKRRHQIRGGIYYGPPPDEGSSSRPTFVKTPRRKRGLRGVCVPTHGESGVASSSRLRQGHQGPAEDALDDYDMQEVERDVDRGYPMGMGEGMVSTDLPQSPTEAFASIFTWIHSQPRGFTSPEEEHLLFGLAHRASQDEGMREGEC